MLSLYHSYLKLYTDDFYFCTKIYVVCSHWNYFTEAILFYLDRVK